MSAPVPVPSELAAYDHALVSARTALKFVGEPKRAVAIPKPPARAATTPIMAASPTLEPCGGDLPPCFVKQRESGGDYRAYNPTGCGGNGCFGAWQFSGAWAGKLGLPLDLSLATPAQQDAAARELWANGAGASNWGL